MMWSLSLPCQLKAQIHAALLTTYTIPRAAHSHHKPSSRLQDSAHTLAEESACTSAVAVREYRVEVAFSKG
jgi:hypothetical protein